jgi:TP901-1 family phage major tail protein
MAAQRGKDLLLNMYGASGTFIGVAGLRSHTLSLNAQTIDATHLNSSGRWRELLSGAGVLSAQIAGGGIFKDATSDALMQATFFAGAVRSWQIVIPDFGRIEGLFQIAALSFTAPHDAEVTFNVTLISAGELTFTAI